MIALVMAIAAGKSAEEKRWVRFDEINLNNIECDADGTHCTVVDEAKSESTAESWTKKASSFIHGDQP